MYRILRQRGNMSILPFMAECVSFRGNRRQKGANDESLVAEPRDTRTSQALQIGGGPAGFPPSPLRRSAGL